MDRIHVFVFGHVQGVFFRAGVQKEAKRLGVVGWARNLEDESVEILAEGECEALEELLMWCYRGPKDAKVKELEYNWLEAQGDMGEFSVL